jgi:phage terminase large subunit GpA-like protein
LRPERTPHLWPILERCSDPRFQDIVLACGSQLAKTQGALVVIGKRYDHDPVPCLYVGPTKTFVETRFHPRLHAMLHGVESLEVKLAKGKAERKTAKVISGVPLRLAWSGSAAELAGDPAGFAIVDERDRMGPTDEGDVVELARSRGATFADFKMLVLSSPGLGTVNEEADPDTGMIRWGLAENADIESPIWKLWQAGTRDEWAWPCPRCGEYFIPRFSRLVFDSKESLAVIERETKMRCPYCDRGFGTERKTDISALGRYVSPGQAVSKRGVVEGRGIDSRTASHWVSGLASPWRTFGQAAARYVKAARTGDPAALRVVVNTELGELYAVRGEAPRWETVADRREPYRRGESPSGVRLITAGVDPAKDRFDYVVRGWGARMESWLLRWDSLWGDTDSEVSYQAVAELLHSTWGQSGIPVKAMLVDSGWRPGEKARRPEHRIYDFCRRFPGWARPSKGYAVLDQPVKLVKIDYTTANQRIAGAVELVHVDTDHMKRWIHGRLAMPVGTPGAWHIGQEATDQYCKQISAESRITTAAGKSKWVRHGPNHAFDCEVLALAAAWLFGLPLLQERLDAARATPPPAPAPVIRSKFLMRGRP